jgi:Fuc2NAc and GlcNAc transferase
MAEAWHWALVVACLTLAVGLTGSVRRHALRAGVMDIPNARSSHSQPTPRGGGIAIVVTVCVAALGLWLVGGSLPAPLVAALVGAGGLVAAVGYLDDRSGLSATVRFGTHLAAAVLALLLLGPAAVAASVLPGLPDSVSWVVAVLTLVWALNLFNFMDGIDGIAASEAAFVSGAAAFLIDSSLASGGVVTVLAALSAACLGFLVWNWAPARIFMGDVGSGFLGFAIALLAIAAVVEGSLSLWTWLILTSLFVADATVTLLRRVLRGERWYAAHRSHAYQHLTRRWRSHRRVTLLFALVNVLVILPLAVWSVSEPRSAPVIAAVTLLVVSGLALLAGAGRTERTGLAE